MRSTFAICALFVLLASVSAETLSKARLRAPVDKDIHSEATFLALKSTPFGKNLFAMMSLKFQSSGKLDSILNLLGELDSNIAAQQAADDSDFATTSAAYQQTISDQNSIISTAETNIAAWTQDIASDQDTLTQKNDQLTNLQTEDTNIRNFLSQLADTRARENAAFNQRVSDQTAMIDGIQEVIALFSSEVSDNSDIDPTMAANVISLLNEILASLQASIAQDTQAENDAENKYQAFVAAQAQRLADIADDEATLTSDIATLTNDISNLQVSITSETTKETNAQSLLASTQAALVSLTSNYNSNTSVRQSQHTLISQVEQRLQSNPNSVQTFLNDVPDSTVQ